MSEKHQLHHHLGLTEYVSEASQAVWNLVLTALVSQHTQAITICLGGFGEPGTRDCSFPFLLSVWSALSRLALRRSEKAEEGPVSS